MKLIRHLLYALCAVYLGFSTQLHAAQPTRTHAQSAADKVAQLCQAAFEGNVGTLRYLIEKMNMSPNVLDKDSFSPLHYAAYNGHRAAITYLIHMGANIRAHDQHGFMPIHMAAIKGHTPCIKLFVHLGNNHNELDAIKQTILHIACREGHLATIKYLIRQKMDPCLQNAHGLTPMHRAAQGGHTHVIKYFITKLGIDKDIQTKNGQTPLHVACQYGHLHTVRYLMQQKANPNARDKDKNTPMHFAAFKGHTAILKFFIEGNLIDINVPGPENHTPLHCASLKGHLTSVKFLVEQHANTKALTSFGAMPIHLAAYEGRIDVLQYFIKQAGLDKDIADEKGQTPLHCAALAGKTEAVTYLLKLGADHKAQTKSGRTPLFFAWTNGHSQTVHALTGLLLKFDAYNQLIPASEHPAKTAEWKKLMCIGYISTVTAQLEAIAKETAEVLGLKDIFFYYTSRERSHATSLGFEKIGLSKNTLLAGITLVIGKLFSKRCKRTEKVCTLELDFKRVLYHELCHIKANDTGLYFKEKIKNTDNAALAREMAAELGAMYYLFKLDKKALFIYTVEDDEHPTERELWRYIAHLYARLIANPEHDLSVVEELAQLYRQEKESGKAMVPDIILPTAGALVKLKMLSERHYSNVYNRLKRVA